MHKVAVTTPKKEDSASVEDAISNLRREFHETLKAHDAARDCELREALREHDAARDCKLLRMEEAHDAQRRRLIEIIEITRAEVTKLKEVLNAQHTTLVDHGLVRPVAPQARNSVQESRYSPAPDPSFASPFALPSSPRRPSRLHRRALPAIPQPQ